ncbi:MAG: T9SS type A sorting domain-containing protein [Bacteroidota bacterium]
MKRKITRSLVMLALIVSPLFFSSGVQSQTAGTLTCTYTTTSTGGYTPENCIAAWIETNSGTFIKTKFKYCKSSDIGHLATWNGKSGGNTTDALTSSTNRTVNGVMTFVWNGTNVSTAIVTDGVYKVWVEFAWAASLTTGKTVQSFTFNKGTIVDHQAPAPTTNLTGITLDWVPLGVGVAENEASLNFLIAPNPVSSQSTVNYSLVRTSDVTITLYDATGKLVNVLFDGIQDAGNYSLPLLSRVNVKPGIYFVKMYTGKTQHTERIFISK